MRVVLPEVVRSEDEGPVWPPGIAPASADPEDLRLVPTWGRLPCPP